LNPDCFVLFFLLPLFRWKIMFACLVVCRWQVWHGVQRRGRGRSRRPGVENRGWSHRSSTRWSGGREIRWRRVRSAPGTWRLGAWVSWLSLKTKVDGL
jgi:hypothetical protein